MRLCRQTCQTAGQRTVWCRNLQDVMSCRWFVITAIQRHFTFPQHVRTIKLFKIAVSLQNQTCLHFPQKVLLFLVLTCVLYTWPETSRWNSHLCKCRQSLGDQSAKGSGRTAPDRLGCGPAQRIPLPFCTRWSWTPALQAEHQSKTGNNKRF